MSLFLIGYRGTGKSTVARLLAARLGWEAVDADLELERRAGKSIARMFAEDGEPAFRDLESLILAELVLRPNIVLAAGGGAILRGDNREALVEHGTVVWLHAPADTLLDRITSDHSTSVRRPKLTAQGGAAEVRKLLAQREPLYRLCAAFDVSTEGKPPEEVCAEILDRLRQLPQGAPA